MEKDFSKAISNNEKKKKRNSRFYYNSKSIHFFRNRTKNREFHFRNTKLSYTNKNFQGACHLLQKPCFCPSLVEDGFREIRIVEFLGAVIFTPYFSISIRREGGERLYSQRTSRHLCTRTRPSGTVYVTQLKSRYLRIQRKERGGAFSTHIFSRPHLVRLLSRHPRRAVVESCSGYDESRLSWSRSYSIPPVHRIFAYLKERDRERERSIEREFFQWRREHRVSYY